MKTSSYFNGIKVEGVSSEGELKLKFLSPEDEERFNNLSDKEVSYILERILTDWKK